MVEELCQPKVPASGKACDIMSTANVSRFVLISVSYTHLTLPTILLV